MRRVLIAIAILATTALPSFADGGSHCDECGAGSPGNGMMRHPEIMRQMMRDPQHLLMRAYHHNLAVFARTLAKVARQGETVPPDVARTAVAEMRRSAEQMEKLRAAAPAGKPAGMAGHEQMQKALDDHLVAVKTHLRQLEELTRKDRIPSQEVLQHLEVLSQGCGDVVGGRGKSCGEGRHMHNPGCRCQDVTAMPERRQMMQKMLQRMKDEDRDMARQVDKMKRAPREKRMDILSDLVARLVQQRAELTSHMEKMQQHMMHGQPMDGMPHRGAWMAPAPATEGVTGDTPGEDETYLGMDDADE